MDTLKFITTIKKYLYTHTCDNCTQLINDSVILSKLLLIKSRGMVVPS